MSKKRNRRATRPQTKHTQVKRDETRTSDEKSLETAVESDTINANGASSAEEDRGRVLSDEITTFADTNAEVPTTPEEKTEEVPSDDASEPDALAEEAASEDVFEENVSEDDATPSTTENVETEDVETASDPDEIHSDNTDDDLAFLDDENDDEDFDEEDFDEKEDDDEVFMSSDRVIHTEDSLAIVQQMDNVVSWEIVNFYKDNGKVPNRFVMRNSPPVFKISSNDGSAAEFLVTKDLAKTFEKIFGDVSKAYYGVDPTVKKKPFNQTTLKEKASDAIEWAKENPFKASLLVLVIIFIAISPFIYG